jgi:hypothetical protein
MTYKEDKKKLKKFFQNDRVNPEKVLDKCMEEIDERYPLIIECRWGFYEKGSTHGYLEIYERSWSDVSENVVSNGGDKYSPQWTSTLFNEGIWLLNYMYTEQKEIKYMEKELRKFVKKENISDKSVYLYIHKHFLFYDQILHHIGSKSLRDYYLFR